MSSDTLKNWRLEEAGARVKARAAANGFCAKQLKDFIERVNVDYLEDDREGRMAKEMPFYLDLMAVLGSGVPSKEIFPDDKALRLFAEEVMLAAVNSILLARKYKREEVLRLVQQCLRLTMRFLMTQDEIVEAYPKCLEAGKAMTELCRKFFALNRQADLETARPPLQAT